MGTFPEITREGLCAFGHMLCPSRHRAGGWEITGKVGRELPVVPILPLGLSLFH